MHGIDHLELWVGNARQAAHFWMTALGFDAVATLHPHPDRVSHVLTQGDIRLVITGARLADSEVAAHVRRHGHAVRTVAFRVADATRSHDHAVAGGARSVQAPHLVVDDRGPHMAASVAAFGDVVHAFIEEAEPSSHDVAATTCDLPTVAPGLPAVGLVAIDHVVGNVPAGTLGEWVDHHVRTLGLQPLSSFGEDVSTDRTALRSTVLRDASGTVTLPLNEPAAGTHRSQIEEFLEANGGPGVQHVAIRTDDIVASVAAMRRRGVRFLDVPRGYHVEARQRVGEVGASWDRLEEHDILVDRDEQGHLLQVFTEPLQDRPTLFLEFIQREGATGFGAGNFGALFAAIEREQAARGNL
nr:4-hydroxyphenylpyruvate dioxygenase [Salsipaludibacter albus]